MYLREEHEIPILAVKMVGGLAVTKNGWGARCHKNWLVGSLSLNILA